MAEIDIVKHDEGGINARILAKENKVDFRRVEAASIKMPTRFASAEGKRLFLRYYGTFQLNGHFISVIARTRLDHAEVEKAEAALRGQMDPVAVALNEAIDGAEALFKAHGITHAATYDTVPLDMDVGVLSSSGRRYLELMVKLDLLMPLLQTLEIHEVISTQAVDKERAVFKRKVRNVANSARFLATRLRQKMNAMEAARPMAIVDRAVARDDAVAGAEMPSAEPADLVASEVHPQAVAADATAATAATAP